MYSTNPTNAEKTLYRLITCCLIHFFEDKILFIYIYIYINCSKKVWNITF